MTNEPESIEDRLRNHAALLTITTRSQGVKRPSIEDGETARILRSAADALRAKDEEIARLKDELTTWQSDTAKETYRLRQEIGELLIKNRENARLTRRYAEVCAMLESMIQVGQLTRPSGPTRKEARDLLAKHDKETE